MRIHSGAAERESAAPAPPSPKRRRKKKTKKKKLKTTKRGGEGRGGGSQRPGKLYRLRSDAAPTAPLPLPGPGALREAAPRGGAERIGAAARGGQWAAGCGLRRGSTRGSRVARTRRAGPGGPQGVRGGVEGLLWGCRLLGLSLAPGKGVGGEGLHQPPIFCGVWAPPKCTLLGEAVLRNVMARLRGRVARLRVMWRRGGQGCAKRFCKGKRPAGRAACLDGEIFEVSDTLLLLRCA